MDESLQNGTTQTADEIASALGAQRDQARKFVSQWRNSAAGLEQQLVAQLEATMRDLSSAMDSGTDGAEEIQRRHSELAELERRLNARREELSAREQQLQEQAAQAQSTQTRLDERIDKLQALFEELDERRTSVKQAEAQLAATQSENQQAAQSVAKDREEIAQQRAQLAQQREEVARQQEKIAQQQEEVAQQRADLARQRDELQQRQQQLDNEAAKLAAREQDAQQRERELSESRRQLARELKVRRKEQLTEIDRRRAELESIVASEDRELEGKFAQFQEELSRLQTQSDQRSAQADELRRQLEASQAQLAQRESENRELVGRLEQIASADNRNSAEAAKLSAQLAEYREKAESQNAATEAALQKARDEQQQLRDELASAGEQLAGAKDQIATMEQQAESLRAKIEAAGDESTKQRIRELESERDALVEKLADAEAMSERGGRASEASEELQKRLEAALSEVRDLKLRNAKLEEKTSSGGVVGGAMDWETQKRMMLEKLEADIDENDPDQAADKLTVEGAIRMTDQAIAEKETELEELRRLLADQSQNLGGVAVGAAAIAEMLDGDDLVKQEREKLESLQQEWREKLRKAEIDISVERAKIARERAQLEERLQILEQRTITSADGNEEPSEAPKRGKWLARLGLGDGK